MFFIYLAGVAAVLIPAVSAWISGLAGSALSRRNADLRWLNELAHV
jgi:hypothetical protein